MVSIWPIAIQRIASYLDWLPTQDKEGLRSLGQEPRELVHQDILNLVRLLYLDADANTVDAGLDEDSLVFIPGDSERVE